jgi:3-deoxy-7-phosphoheptulonate synthase
MILVIKENTMKQEVDDLVSKLAWMNLQGIATEENGRYSIAIVSGADPYTDFKQFALFPLVEKILPFTQKFKLASRELKKDRTVINIKGRQIGGGVFAVMAGPCSGGGLRGEYSSGRSL